MKLTGKCKEDFEKWWKIDHIKHQLEAFYDLPPSMLYGVMVDFFDSVGIYISDCSDNTLSRKDEPFFNHWGFSCEVELDCEHYETAQYKTRPQAREQAILKANEIYNDIR